MDSIKDIQKTQNIGRFIDATPVKTNPFGSNRSGERAYRRSERISAALHLLTNHISESEPVRRAIRSKAIELLSAAVGLRNEMRASGSGQVLAFSETIRELISHVRILAVSGYVSEQNAGVMIDALDELGNYVHVSERTPLSESILLSRDELMDIGTPRPTKIVKDTKDVLVIKDSPALKDIKPRTVSDTSAISNGQMSLRRRNILEVLRASGALGIREIASNLPEYSEKMIQRELLLLVSDGKVSKAGLKRWSRYALIQ